MHANSDGRRLGLIIALLAAALVVAPAAAQQAAGSAGGGRIQGVVHPAGPHGHDNPTLQHNPISQALVHVVGTGHVVRTDDSGAFVLGPLPAGTYVIEVRSIGFRPVRQVVRVSGDQVTEVALHMQVMPLTIDAKVVEALREAGGRTFEVSALNKVTPVGAANVTTVTARQLEQVNAANPWELIREATGLEVHEQGQGPGFASDAVVRGFTSDHSADVGLVMDGVPLNEPINGHGEGYADWSLLLPGTIADVQLIKGPISPLFGNFAAGGALNVTTRASTDRTLLEAHGGSYGAAGGSLTTGLERGPWGAFLGLAGLRTSGWRDNSGHQTLHGAARVNRRVAGGWLVDAGANVFRSTWDSPGFLSLDEFDRGALTGAVDSTDGGEKTHVLGRVTAAYEHAGMSWHNLVWGYASRWHLFLNIPELGGEGEGLGRQTEELDERFAFGARSIARWARGSWELTAGVEGQRHAVTYDIFATTRRAREFTINRFEARQVTLAALVGASRTFGRRFRAELGMRADHVRPTTFDRVSRVDRPFTARTIVQPKLGAVWYAPGDIHVYGSVARGFRSAPGTIGDPTRQPVDVWAYEAGVRIARAQASGAIALFRLETDHERLFNPVTLRTESDGWSVREGVEMELRVHALPGIELHTHWTFNLTGRYFRPAADTLAPTTAFTRSPVPSPFHVQHEESPGERVPAVADYTGRVGMTLRPNDGVGVTAWVTVMGPYVPLGEPTVETAAYGLGNIEARVRITPRVELALGVDNVANTRAPELRASGAVNPVAARALHARLITQWR